MTFKRYMLTVLFSIPILTACVSMPTGPSVMVLPGSNKSFEQFRYDDTVCKQYAYDQVNGETAKNAAINSGLNSAAIGAGLGAIAGAALGGGRGAAIGGGTGLLAGGLTGSGAARTSASIAQQHFDNNYVQCMYAQGHRVPVAGDIRNNPSPYSSNTISVPTQYRNYPPPPPY